jgi:hypothetical protein
MSFKFPNFNLQSIQDSLPSLEQVKESVNKVNKEQIQPFTLKTGSLISQQISQVQQLALESNVEVSELPQDYLQLEANCDLLLKLYSELIQFNSETYGKVSYDYPPANYAISKLKDANVGEVISSKFNQLKNVSSPQELEKIFMGEKAEENEVSIQTISIPKTLYGQLSVIAEKHGEELKSSDSPLALALLQISSSYVEIASARLDQDSTIIRDFNDKLVAVMNDSFIKVHELRKKVYHTRSEFDMLRSKSKPDDEENEELISKEDELVAATEMAVVEMKRLLKPSQSIDLIKVLVKAQKEYHAMAAKKLTDLLSSLDKIEVNDDDD